MAKTDKSSISAYKEAEYTIEEFKEAAERLFGCNKACVGAALRKHGIIKATEEKAKKIVNDFMKKEVNK